MNYSWHGVSLLFSLFSKRQKKTGEQVYYFDNQDILRKCNDGDPIFFFKMFNVTCMEFYLNNTF